METFEIGTKRISTGFFVSEEKKEIQISTFSKKNNMLKTTRFGCNHPLIFSIGKIFHFSLDSRIFIENLNYMLYSHFTVANKVLEI